MSLTKKNFLLPIVITLLTFTFVIFFSWGSEEKKPSVTKIGTEGFFRLVKENGIWWFFTPEGNKFVSLGINHIEPILLCSDNNKELFTKKYGQDLIRPGGHPNIFSAAAKLWLDDSMNLIKQWEFNTLGVHNPTPQSKMPYVAKFRPSKVDGWAGLKRNYMDPFDPNTLNHISQLAKKWCEKNKDDTMILGISLNDMPQWRSSPEKIHEWVKFCMELGAESPGKQRWVEVLRKNYAGASAAAAAYGIEASSWTNFLLRTSWPAPVQPTRVFKDVQTFLPLIADNWFRISVEALRKYDQNHLIFGDKFEGKRNLPLWLDPIIKKYFDITYIQWYEYAHTQIPRLKQLYATTGKPVLMGDSSFSCPNQNIPRPKGVHVSSQKEVGNAYYTYLQSMLAEPFVIGWHFCGFIEGSPDLKKFHLYFSIQNGLLRPDGTPYKETIPRVTEANKKAFSWHENARSAAATGEKIRTVLQRALPSPSTFSLAPRQAHAAERCKNEMLNNYIFTTIDDNVYNVGQFRALKTPAPKKNISWIVTDEGVVVIDTGNFYSAKIAREKIRETTGKPIKYIIYTHHHGTQVGGTAILKDPETKVIAHEDLVTEFDLLNKFYGYNDRLNSIQFNFNPPSSPKPFKRVYPDITFKNEYSFSLGGVKFDLYHVAGEAQDYTIIFLPDQKILWVGDMVGGGMPMVASPMKRVRDEVKWKKGLEFMKSLKPEIIINAAHLPFCGEELITQKLDSIIGYLDFLHESVAREMNAGSSLEETLRNIQLPEHMKSNPLLQERYGSLQFNVRGLYHRYSGWFDQNGTHLNPAPAKEKAENFIKDMGGGKKVLKRIQSLEKKSNYKLALEYLDLLIAAGIQLKEAHTMKGTTLQKMSTQYTHQIKANMYRRLAIMERGKANQIAK